MLEIHTIEITSMHIPKFHKCIYEIYSFYERVSRKCDLIYFGNSRLRVGIFVVF